MNWDDDEDERERQKQSAFWDSFLWTLAGVFVGEAIVVVVLKYLF